MMKKTTSALAIAALLGTGAASAATFQVNDDATISIGGDFQIAYNEQTASTGVTTTTFEDNASSLVFSGEHSADNGLTTFFTLDLDGFDTAGGSGSIVTDEASVGVRGDFGHVKAGADVSAFDKYADFADVAQTYGLSSFSEGDADRLVEYGNSLGGVEFVIQAEVGDQTGSTSDNTSTTSLSGGFSADLGGISVMGAYDQRANETDDEAIYGIGLNTNIAGVDLTAGYQTDQGTNNIDIVSLTGSYSAGAVTFVGAIQNTSFDSAPLNANDDDLFGTDGDGTADQTDDTFTEVYAGVIYNVTDQMYVYGEMATRDRENDQGDTMAMGVYYGW